MTARSVLVTGGNGFIGRHLVRRLADDGHRLTLLQRSADGVDGRVELVCLSEFDETSIVRALSGRRFEWLFHLLGYGVRPGDRDPETMDRINVRVTCAMARAAAAWPARVVVIAGSGSEYRLDGVEQPIAEDHPIETVKLYGASKARGTQCAMELAEARNLPLAVCRLFGVYGPGEAPHRLLPSLFGGLQGGGRVALSPGQQKRDFLFVSDAVDAFVRVADLLHRDPQRVLLNVGTGEPIAVREFAQRAAAILDVPEDRLGFGDIAMRPDETMVFSGNPSRLHALTGWSASVALDDGIQRCLQASRHLS